MPVVNGNVLEVVFRQSYLGQNMYNIWQVEITDNASGMDASAIAVAFRDTIGGLINAVQVDAVNNVQVDVQNLSDQLTFGSVVWNGNGDMSLPGLPSYVAYAIRLNRGNKLTRNGYKRVGGVPEAVVTNNLITDAATLTNLQTLADGFADGGTAIRISTGEAVGYQPQIVGRTLTGAYDLSRRQDVAGGIAYDTISSQVSRKQSNS